MSRINKEGKLPTRRMKCAACGCEFEYTQLDVRRFYYLHGGYISAENRMPYDNCVFCPCCDARIKIQPRKPIEDLINSDFMEDVKALAKQYGLKIDNIEVSNNN